MMRWQMMRPNRFRLGLLVLLALVILFAWFDGGREPQRMIEENVELAPAEAGR
jgi:hypothetical protein